MTDAVARWLVYEAPPVATVVELLHGVATRLAAAGIDLLRLNLLALPLSPQASRVFYMWRPANRGLGTFPAEAVVGQELHELDGGFVHVTAFGHDAMQSPRFLASPFQRILGGQDEVRCAISPTQNEFEFPILADLQAQGATEYLAFPVQFHDGARSAISFVTARNGGFGEAQAVALRHLLRPLVLALSPRLAAHTLRTLLGAYLGPNTAERVLSGVVQRGDVEEIEAAVWFSDLRGFTPMSAGVGPSELIRWLNDYFAVVGRAIAQHEGEILKFIGDAILAVWPVSAQRTREPTCAVALRAARAANTALDALNEARVAASLPPMQHGIGLHVGRVQYGNIGAEGRLDFTVIGPAVNTASRLEGACAGLSRRVVTSADFAACVPGELVALTSVALKGIAAPQTLFGLDQEKSPLR